MLVTVGNEEVVVTIMAMTTTILMPTSAETHVTMLIVAIAAPIQLKMLTSVVL